MGDKPTLTPWRIRLEADDAATIYAYQDKPRNLALGQHERNVGRVERRVRRSRG